MTRYLDGLLRGTGPVGLLPGLGVVAAGGAAYGAVMGCFGGVGGDRPWQVVYAAVKVPLLLVVTTALAVPSFFVLNSLLGLRGDFRAAARAVAGAQAAVAIVLAALAPYTAVWYLTSGDYGEALLFNAVVFAAASLAAQWVLRRRYAPLVARDRRHRVAVRAWLGVYAFVGVQMGWVLRPFVGDPARPVTFFRDEPWGNAYVTVADILWRAVMG
ncbi:MAG: hypothetical protein K2X82_33615 [Gemmataceae bacterium]|nr:hypothetical protein [Gemmataceae bacterium]